MQTHIYFNVAKNGQHLFRTDWYLIYDGVDQIRNELAQAFPAVKGYTIQQYSRDEAMESVDIEN